MPRVKNDDYGITASEELLERLTRIENLLATIVEILESINNSITSLPTREKHQAPKRRIVEEGEEEVIWRGRGGKRREYGRTGRKTGKRTAYDILTEQGVMFESDLKNVTYKDKLFSSLRNKGAIIIETDRERIATTNEYLDDLLEEIRGKTPDEALDELKGKKKRLYEALRESGYLIYRNGKWILDLND